MLGELTETAKMDGDVVMEIEPSVGGSIGPSTTITPPPSKKFKQARLPFKPLDVKSPPVGPGGKKRKLSDGLSPLQKGNRPAKTEDKISKQRRLDIENDGNEDNEVSSSSEAESASKIDSVEKPEKPSKVGLMDRFVKTKPRPKEVVVDSSTDIIDLTENKEEKEEKDDDDDDLVVTEAKDAPVTKETMDDKSENDAQVDEGKNDKSESNKTDEKTAKGKEDDDELDAKTTPAKRKKDETVATPIDEDENDESNTDDKDTFMSPTSKTPGSKIKPKTPKSQSKDLEKQKKKDEKEKERLEKIRQKEEARKKKEEEKAEKEKQKKEEKEKKEKERLEVKAKKEQERLEKEKQKEQERLEKEKMKEEEKKKKQEAVEAKLAEKRKKEEEKKKQEEEKVKEEEEKLQKEKALKSNFMKFFTKAAKTSPPPKQASTESEFFIGFEVKKDMRLAASTRREISDEARSVLDQGLLNQSDDKLYLDQIKSKSYRKGKCGVTWNWMEERSEEDVEVVEEEQPAEQPTVRFMKAKLFQFHENTRPAWYGTWRRKSKFIHPRKPLKLDEVLLDYEIDSDDEWEEEEPGESLSHSEGEDDNNEEPNDNDDEEEDGFFVPHGYLSEDECGEDEEDMSPQMLKEQQKARARAFEQDLKKKCQTLKAIIIGCHWLGSQDEADPNVASLQQYKMCPFVSKSPILTTFNRPVSTPDKGKASQEGGKEEGGVRGVQKKSVPEEALPDLIRLVHGNCKSSVKIIREFREYWRLKSLGKLPSPQGVGGVDQMEVDPCEDSSSRPVTPASRPATPALSGSPTPEASPASNKPTPSSSPRPNTPQIEGDKEGAGAYDISKRQLDITMKTIAVFEKREGTKNSRWYVQQNILEKHKLTDLPVPNQWQYVTIQTVKKRNYEKKTAADPAAAAATPESGRKTPNITQFAVAMSPSQLAAAAPTVAPSSVPVTTPKSQTKPKSQINSTTPSRSISAFARPISPATLFKQMGSPKAASSTPAAAKVAKKSPAVSSSSTLPKSQPPGGGNENENQEEDMMIDLTLPTTAPKNQPTVLSMFTKNPSKPKAEESSNQGKKAVNIESSSSVILIE